MGSTQLVVRDECPKDAKPRQVTNRPLHREILLQRQPARFGKRRLRPANPLGLLEETRDCLRDRGFNAFLAIDVGIEVGSVLENRFSTADMAGPAADATPPAHARRVLVATEPSVRSAMLGAVHARWDASVRTFAEDLVES